MSEREIAQKAEEKFDFYVISLVFTLLALSIQSAEFGSSSVAGALELTGWLLLLVSGVVGLWRLEYLPVIRLKRTMKQEFEDEFYEIKRLKLQGVQEIDVLETGKAQNLDERLQNKQQAIDIISPVIADLEKHNQIKYRVFRSAFIFGLISLVLARAYVPFTTLLCAIGNT